MTIILAIFCTLTAFSQSSDFEERINAIETKYKKFLEPAEDYRSLLQITAKNPIDYDKVEANLKILSSSVVSHSQTLDGLDIEAESNLTGWLHRVVADNLPEGAVTLLPLWGHFSMDASFDQENNVLLPINGVSLEFGARHGIGFRGLTAFSYLDSVEFDFGTELSTMELLPIAIKSEQLGDYCNVENNDAALADFAGIISDICAVVEEVENHESYKRFLISIKPRVDRINSELERLIGKYGEELAGQGSFLVRWATSHEFKVETCDGFRILKCTPHFSVSLSAGVIVSDADFEFVLTEDKISMNITADSAGRATDQFTDRVDLIKSIYVLFKVTEELSAADLKEAGKWAAESIDRFKSEFEGYLNQEEIVVP